MKKRALLLREKMGLELISVAMHAPPSLHKNKIERQSAFEHKVFSMLYFFLTPVILDFESNESRI